MVCPQPTYYQFLTLYVSRFDIGIWSSTTQTILTLIVQLLIKRRVKNKLMFVWGGEKCESTCVCHPLNKKRPLVLKNVDKVF
jgi:hypothetical protein